MRKAYLVLALGLVALVVFVTSCAPAATPTPTIGPFEEVTPTPFGEATVTVVPTPTEEVGVTPTPTGLAEEAPTPTQVP